MQKLMTKSAFAKMAGVNPSTLTRVSKTELRRAVSGKHIDAGHADAVAYVEKQKHKATPLNANGVDPMYEQAVEICQSTGRYTAGNISKHLKIGNVRANSIVAMMNAANLVPEHPKPADIVIPTSEPPKPRGQAVVKAAKKSEPPPENSGDVFTPPEEISDFLDMTIRDVLQIFGTDTRFVDWLTATQKIEGIEEKRLKNAQTKGTLISRALVRDHVVGKINDAHLRLMKDGAKSIAAGVISKHSSGAELAEVEAYISDILGSFIKPVKTKIKRTLENA